MDFKLADLPIAAHAGEITALLASHQVLIVAGETGSGKTTQLPKLCLAAGRQSIGHTQPRRIAARTVAARIAGEIGEPLGETVGFQVRFTRQTSSATKLKVMTDGVLLAEIAHDPGLRRYDTVIVDEAHERSLNIDFLLGYLKRLLPERPDLKVIVTSATIDTARFSAHFGGAPIVQVEGRTFPVAVRYEPMGEDDDQAEAIVAALAGLPPDGDVLVFCAGERDIKEAAKAITAARFPATEVLPLFARLSAAEQDRVFTPHAGRRVVLATNVAETSLTVPGIRAVVDPGLARISRYSARTKVQRLPIEPVSRASADQRAGRCGRVGPGICVRLYSEADFRARPEFTEPEILRTNLAAVILQMAAAKLGDIAAFPFVEAPERAHIADGIRLLRELGAVEGDDQALALTAVGRQMAALPVDPKLGRILLAAAQRHCLKEAITLAAALSLPDVRERRAPAQPAETGAQPLSGTDAQNLWATRFRQPGGPKGPAPSPAGDFLELLELWRRLRAQRRELGSSQFRKWCLAEHLHYLRVREWQDLVMQLRDSAKELKLHLNPKPAPVEEVLRALLAGFLANIGALQETAPEPKKRRGPREYTGTRGARFAISPGSVLAQHPPDLVMAAELIETTRLWAHTVAAIEPEWAEEAGRHLVKRSYSEPHFAARSATVRAAEKTTLLGVTLFADRQADYARVDPAAARTIFIQAALVEDQWEPRPGTAYAGVRAHNRALREKIEDLQDRSRRRDLLADDYTLFSFFDARLPDSVVSGASLERWLKADPANAAGLLMAEADLARPGAGEVDPDEYPDIWTFGPQLPLDYRFEPGSARDGVVAEVPLAQLAGLSEAPFTWGVPGLRRELATALLRALPKAQRTRLAPIPDTAAKAVAWLERHGDRTRPFPDELARAVEATTGVRAEGWDEAAVPDYLKLGFLVRQGRNETFGRDLARLQADLAPKVTERLVQVSSRPRRQGTSWVFGDLPGRITVKDKGRVASAYPCLRDDQTTVSEVLQATEAAARKLHARGLTRLLWFALPDPSRSVTAHLSRDDLLALATSPYESSAALMADARLAGLDQLAAAYADPWAVRTEAQFQALADDVRPKAPLHTQRLVQTAAATLRRLGAVEALLQPLAGTATAQDVRAQLDDLVFPGFLRVHPEPWCWRLPVYLQGTEQRLRAAALNPARDRARLGELDQVLDAYAKAYERRRGSGELKQISYLIEELRLQLFAQPIRTAEPVSVKKLLARLGNL